MRAGRGPPSATARPPYDWGVRELVCLDLDGGKGFVDRLKRAWDEGDAVFPLDRRLPPPARETILAAVAPTIVADESGDTRVAGRPVEPGDAMVVATSGTTGSPKAAVLTLDALLAGARASSARLGVVREDAWYACLPLSHVGGMSVVARSVLMGTRLLIDPAFTVAGYERAAASGATLVSLVGTALRRVDPSLYRAILLGGSRAPSSRPPNTVATYGLTESGSGVVYDGRPLDGVEIEIRGGVIHLRAPMLLRCYRDGSVPLDHEGWFRTGDIGGFDADGRLRVEGREGDLIVTGGEKVWPDEVEARIGQHELVLECCVAGVPDPEWGDAVHAWIVPSPAGRPDLDELRGFVKETLPAWCAPRAVHLVDEIPRTALGKPIRRSLSDAARTHDQAPPA